MSKVAKIVTTTEMADGSYDDIVWYSNDYHKIKEYWYDRNNIIKITIDGREVSKKEADYVITRFEADLR